MKRNTQPQPAVVAWPTDEARHTFLKANQTVWQSYIEAARDYRDKAERLDAEIGAKTRELEQLRQHIDGRIEEKRRQDHYAAQAQAAADAVTAALTALGEQPPALPDQLVAGGERVSREAHAAQFGGPPQPFSDDVPHGRCLNCGQDAWRKPASPHHPKGATHSFGATCDPEAEEMTYADLGPVRAEAGP